MKHNRVMRLIILILLSTYLINSVAAAPLPEGLNDDRSILVSYSGVWTEATEAAAYASTVSETTDSSAVLTLETYAQGFTLFFVYDATGAAVDICVDADCTSLDTLGATAQGNIEFTALASGLKTITIQKNTVDSNVFRFDALYIHPTPSESITTENQQTVTFNYDGMEYTGVHDLYVSSGDIAIILILLFIALLQVAQLIERLFS